MGNIGIALQLMVVGMVTVFVILMIVIRLGKWLIQVVNKMAPEETAARRHAAATASAAPVDTRTLAVIRAVVDRITGGEGSVGKVERL